MVKWVGTVVGVVGTIPVSVGCWDLRIEARVRGLLLRPMIVLASMGVWLVSFYGVETMKKKPRSRLHGAVNS